MNVLFWQMILPLGVTGGCAVLVLWLCSRAARRLGGGSLPPWLLAGAMAFYLFPLKGLLPARVQASGAAAAIGGAGRVWAGTAVPLAQAPVWTWLLPRLWLAGVGLLAAAFAGRWLWFRFRLARLRRPAEETLPPELENVRAALYRLPGLTSPFACGLLAPCVYLPEQALTPMQLHHSLSHELWHVRAGHLWYKVFALAAALLHWYSPLAWAACFWMDTLCELDCDRRVARSMTGEERRQYGATLVQLAGAVPQGSGLSHSGRQLANRLAALRAAGSTPRRRAGACLVCGAMALLVGCGAAGQVQAASAPVLFQTAQAESAAPVQAQPEEEEGYIWPVPDYTYVSRRVGDGHRGTDIAAEEGADILAMQGGTVVTAEYDPNAAYGYYVVLNHGTATTLYAHCKELYVEPGQQVEQGQAIAAVGSSGYSTGSHCHVELQVNGVLSDALEQMFPEAFRGPQA